MIAADLPSLSDPPALAAPIWEARKRQRRSGSRSQRGAWIGAITIGTVVILEDGTSCRVVYIDPHGVPWCYPE